MGVHGSPALPGELIDLSGWTHEQWLAATILIFIMLAILVILHRMVKIFRMAGTRRKRPNLRPLQRRRYRRKGE